MYLDDLVPLICRIVNDSLLSGSVPQQFKKAVVSPLLEKKLASTQTVYKKKKKNNRPVSNLSFLSILLREVVLISFAAICWPTATPRLSSLRTVHITVQRQLF